MMDTQIPINDGHTDPLSCSRNQPLFHMSYLNLLMMDTQIPINDGHTDPLSRSRNQPLFHMSYLNLLMMDTQIPINDGTHRSPISFQEPTSVPHVLLKPINDGYTDPYLVPGTNLCSTCTT